MILPGFSPKPPAMPPPVSREDPAIADAKKRERMASLKRRGRASTILASADEDLGAAGNIARPAAAKLG